jgi:hypothetical protein
MPVFRYDTRDVVRRLPDTPLTCEFAAIPATGQILGKTEQLLRLPGRVVTPRELTEAVEALPGQPWPARYRAVAQDGRLALTLPAGAVDGLGHLAAAQHFADRDLPVELSLVPDEQGPALRAVRSDLRETTFAGRPALIGA